MSAGTAHGGLDLASLLLSDHNRIELTPTDIYGKAAKLTEGITDAIKQICVIFNQVPGSVDTANFFVTYNGQYNVTGHRQVLGLSTQQSSQHHSYPAFHIKRSASPNVAICHRPFKRWVLPLLVLGGYYIDMPL